MSPRCPSFSALMGELSYQTYYSVDENHGLIVRLTSLCKLAQANSKYEQSGNGCVESGSLVQDKQGNRWNLDILPCRDIFSEGDAKLISIMSLAECTIGNRIVTGNTHEVIVLFKHTGSNVPRDGCQHRLALQ